MARLNEPNLHVVVVDSQPTGYRTLVALAETQRWHTHFLTSGSAAIKIARRLRAELWMIHVSLPDMSGFDLYEMLREQLERATTFLISDEYDPEEEQRACGIKAHLYLCKDADQTLDCKSLLGSLLPPLVREGDRLVHESAGQPP